MMKEAVSKPGETRTETFRVKVHLYSYFTTLTGCAEVEQEIVAGTQLGELFDKLAVRFPKLVPMRKSTLMAVGVDYQPAGYVLRAGDEVAFFPPVQGG